MFPVYTAELSRETRFAEKAANALRPCSVGTCGTATSRKRTLFRATALSLARLCDHSEGWASARLAEPPYQLEPVVIEELTRCRASASFSELSPDSQPSRKRLGRDRRGRFGNGNSAALKHGKFSMAVAKALLPEQREVLEMFAEREATLLIDLGGSQ